MFYTLRITLEWRIVMNKKIKIFSALISILAFTAIILIGCTKNNDSKKPLIVATSGTLYPASYHDSKTNKLVGYDIEIARAVAKGLDRKIEFKEYNVDGQLTAVKTGKADFAANDFNISPTRQKKFTTSTVYKYSFNSVMVRASDNSGINSWADIKGKKAAGEAGTGYQRLAQQLGATLVNYDNVSNDVYLRDVKNSKTDFIMNDYYLQSLALKAMPNSGLTLPSNLYFNTEEDKSGVGFLMQKGDTKLQKQVNEQLKKLKKDGTIKKLSEKYYGADVTKKPTVKNIHTFKIESKYDGRQ